MTTEAPKVEPSDRRQLLHTGVGMASFQAFSLFAGLLIAAGLGPAGQGRFQLLISTCAFLALFCKLGLDEGAAYIIPRFQQTQPNKVLAVVLYAAGVTTCLSLLVGSVLRAASEPLARSLAALPEFEADLELAPIVLPAMVLVMMSSSLLRGLGRSDLRAYAYYWPAGLVFFLMILFSYADGLELKEAYAARVGSHLLGATVGLIMIARLVRAGRRTLARSEITRLHSFAGWLVFVSLFLYLVGQPLVDLLIVSRYASSTDVGVYSVGARLAALPGSIHAAFVIVLAPTFSRAALQSGDRDTTRYETASTWMAHLTVLSSALVFCLGDYVLASLGSDYVAAGPLLRPILAGYVLAGILGLNGPALLAAGRARTEFALSGIALTLMIVGGLWLAPRFGTIGVAVATGTAVGTLALLRALFCFRLVTGTPPRWLLRVGAAGTSGGCACLLVRLLVRVDGLAGSLLEALVFCGVYVAVVAFQERSS
jgi:O-antigen/teichoic acid export membrane protein